MWFNIYLLLNLCIIWASYREYRTKHPGADEFADYLALLIGTFTAIPVTIVSTVAEFVRGVKRHDV